uniref:Abnormal cell migration protein 18-like fibronectin type I domain-containing protein n=1 Tax=Plectus sambesii TaxID=2011161 RepID=A0A914XRE3_9BILA
MIIAAILLALIAGVFADINSDMAARRRCWSAGNDQPARWWDEGARVDRGRYWYECQNGELQPRGCFNDDKERMFIYGTFVKNGYESQCIIGADNYLQFKFSACVPEGVGRKEPGQTWEDQDKMYWFECQNDDPYLKIAIVGCMTHDKTKRLKIGESYEDGDYLYECQTKYNGSVQMCSVGCVHKGAHYKIGESWPDGDYIYYCKINHGRCQKICVGCQFRQKRLYDGDRYQKDDTVFQCEVRPDKFGHKPVGCVVRDDKGDTIERVVGCKWFSETPESKVEMTCVMEGEKTAVKTLGCIWVHKGYDTLFLYPGTYTQWTQSVDGPALAVACKETSNGRFRVETFPPDQVSTRAAGLKLDQPRGG